MRAATLPSFLWIAFSSFASASFMSYFDLLSSCAFLNVLQGVKYFSFILPWLYIEHYECTCTIWITKYVLIVPDLKCGIKRKIDESEEHENKKKKVRTTFTGRQIFELEKMFENKKYLSSSERTEMAKLLNVTEQQVSHQKKGFF